MKTLRVGFVLGLGILVLGCSGKGGEKTVPQAMQQAAVSAAPVAKKYALKSGIVTFEQSGLLQGTVKVYFDDYGIKERNESYNTEGKLEEIKIADGEGLYVISHRYSDDKVAVRMGSGKFGCEMKFVAEPFTKDEDKAKNNYQRLDDMQVVGKTCQAYSIESRMGKTMFAGWEGLLLYTKVTLSMGENVTQAVSLEENAEVDAALFKVPEDYTVQQM